MLRHRPSLLDTSPEAPELLNGAPIGEKTANVATAHRAHHGLGKVLNIKRSLSEARRTPTRYGQDLGEKVADRPRAVTDADLRKMLLMWVSGCKHSRGN